ncbi:hypothetical protein CEXT_784041 [Caerostris extrusa]|uniref:Uncharacterized protein n=1 Tax=Caerostris extrusa TaxID=172846 RepID=A0AAV4Q2J4_CAEEX|nr:hypothetical protein CEXT_784041 [Caerostris extrusa]
MSSFLQKQTPPPPAEQDKKLPSLELFDDWYLHGTNRSGRANGQYGDKYRECYFYAIAKAKQVQIASFCFFYRDDFPTEFNMTLKTVLFRHNSSVVVFSLRADK